MKLLDLTGQRFGRFLVVGKESTGRRNAVIWKCKCDCGSVKLVAGTNLKSGHSKSCGCYHRERLKGNVGKTHPAWKGGRWKTVDGYINCKVNGRVRPEHRVVMERLIGRKLMEHETVHHKNGIRDDNREDNLELWSDSQPAGQRVKDKLEWAKEFLEQYGFTVIGGFDGAGNDA